MLIDLLKSDTFEFWLPLDMSKSLEITKARGRQKIEDQSRWIEGIASTDHKDLQNENVVQSGIEFAYFIEYGYYNNDHKPGFENKVGEPTEAKITKDGLWTKGYLWVKDFHPGADSIWELAQALEASGSDRQLGFSIQGKVLTREGTRILKAWVQDIAITPSPVNTATWMELVKDMGKSLWATAKDVDDVKKGLSSVRWEDVPLVGEPDVERPGLVTEGINFVYEQLLSTGYSPTESRSRALASVARGLLD